MSARHVNQPLLKKIRLSQHPVYVVTLGFESIVRPLINGFDLRDTQIIAMSPWNARRCARGKLAAVTEVLGADEVRKSLVITDALDDVDILKESARPLRVIWPDSVYVEAFQSTYIPGQYISRVKRPGQQYINRVIIRDDFVFWVLASIALAQSPITHLIGLAFLAASFWTIYEWGYVDNDRIGAKHEDDPNLSDEYHAGGVHFSTVQAWIWAAGFGVTALHLLRWPAAPVGVDYLSWAIVLFITLICFFFYNRLDKPTRIWLYGLLQMLRIAAFVAIVPIPIIGSAAVCAVTIARWIPYLNYRASSGPWVKGRMHTIRLMMFCGISGMMANAVGWHILCSYTAVALLLWNLFKARHELKETVGQAHRIDRKRPDGEALCPPRPHGQDPDTIPNSSDQA
jgi:hypothetical protein